jgi:hypothetical protein
MRSLLKRMLAAVFALTLVMAVPAQPASAETTTTTFQFTEAVFNTCNNDLTVINGKETITTTVIPLRDGSFKYYFRDSKSGTGSGLTGKQYTYTNTFTDSFVTTPQGGLVSTNTSQFITLKKVGGPRSENMDVDVRETITFDATTGEALKVSREFEAECE